MTMRLNHFKLFTFALFTACLAACAVEDPTVNPAGSGGASADPETTPDEDLDETSQAITLTCGATFDCRNYPPPPRSDGRKWNFWGSRYCNTSLSGGGAVTCQWVASGLSTSFPVKLTHSVPAACLACTSNNSRTSTCYNNLYDLSSWSWTCNLPIPYLETAPGPCGAICRALLLWFKRQKAKKRLAWTLTLVQANRCPMTWPLQDLLLRKQAGYFLFIRAKCHPVTRRPPPLRP